jgi:hypothetical protein
MRRNGQARHGGGDHNRAKNHDIFPGIGSSEDTLGTFDVFAKTKPARVGKMPPSLKKCFISTLPDFQ